MPERWAGDRAAMLTRQCLQRDGYRCQLRLPGCAAIADTADHIVPKSKSPELMWVLSNLRAACRHCNSSRGAGLDDGPPVDLPDWFR